MGREVRRVPLDFDWPIGKVWHGFLNPLYVATKCQPCDGSGASATARQLKDRWYGYVPFKPEDRGSTPFTVDDEPIVAFATRNVTNSPGFYGRDAGAIRREARRLCALWNGQWCHHLNADDVAALIAADRLYDFTKTFTPGKGWQPKDPPYVPTAREVNIWSLSGFGHDTINQWVCVEAECERLGFDPKCLICMGEGERWPSAEAKQTYDDWTPTQPPAGEAYQLWETTSEGSPMTPALADPSALARYCADHNVSSMGDQTETYETWLKFIAGPGWAPSMVMAEGRMDSGVAAVVSK